MNADPCNMGKGSGSGGDDGEVESRHRTEPELSERVGHSAPET